VPDEVVLRSEYYADWMKPQGFAVGPNLGGVIGVHGKVRSYLGIYQPEGAREYGGKEYALCRLPDAHPRRAIEFDRHFRSSRWSGASPSTRSTTCTGLILLDRQGRIVGCNRIAEEVVAMNDGLCIDGKGLAAAVHSETRKLRILIHQAARRQGLLGGSLSLTRPSGKPDFEVLVTWFSGTSLEGLEGRHVAAALIEVPLEGPPP
jgi:PAS domain-containing protein